MNVRIGGSDAVIVLDRGDDLVGSLTGALETHRIHAAAIVSGIGACDAITVSYFDLDAKKYLPTVLDGPHELVSMSGNVALREGRPFVHAHTAWSDREGRLFGGHLVTATVHVTVELFLRLIPVPMLRAPNAATTLWHIEL
jgi:predicted DNA-binding protein with PD1-like motif